MNTILQKRIKSYVDNIQGVIPNPSKPDETMIVDLIGYNAGLVIILGPHGEETIELKHFKPILRPLYQITETITIDGNEIIPIDVINNEIYIIDGVKEGFSYTGVNEFGSPRISYCGLTSGTLVLPYYIVNRLLEWGFDLDRFINKGLAESFDERTIVQTSRGMFEVTNFSKYSMKEMNSFEWYGFPSDMDEDEKIKIIDTAIDNDSGKTIYRRYGENDVSFFDPEISPTESFKTLFTSKGIYPSTETLLIKL